MTTDRNAIPSRAANQDPAFELGREVGIREEQDRVYKNFKTWERRMTPDERGAVLNVLLASTDPIAEADMNRIRDLYEGVA